MNQKAGERQNEGRSEQRTRSPRCPYWKQWRTHTFVKRRRKTLINLQED
jgi:hypothetical protein